jgi:hypothetical protein
LFSIISWVKVQDTFSLDKQNNAYLILPDNRVETSQNCRSP